jgi:tRNA(fMet)-specific endonuclease VapC
MELIFGAERSGNPDKNLRVLQGFVARLDVISL